MKRDFLKELDLGEGARLPDAAVEAIMAEHGKTTGALQESIKALTQERDKLQNQLAEAAESAKQFADYAEIKSQRDELQKNIDTRNARDKVSAETGVPASLLAGETEEACKAQADAILQWHGAQAKYPEATGVGGEPPEISGGATRDQFAEWATAALNKT